jgi:hypothetical protein
VTVDVNRDVWVGLAERSNQQCGSLGLEQSSHVLDSEDVDTAVDELLGKVEIVLESVLGLLRVGDISGIALCKQWTVSVPNLDCK